MKLQGLLNEAENPFLALWVDGTTRSLVGSSALISDRFKRCYKLMAILLLVPLGWMGFAKKNIAAGFDPAN